MGAATRAKSAALLAVSRWACAKSWPWSSFFVGAAFGLEDDRGGAAEGGFVANEGGAVQVACGVDAVAGDRLDAAEIEKDHAAVGLEQVVAGVRIGVEHAAD